jgi:hypothetical protein
LFVELSQFKQCLKNTVTNEDDVHDKLESGALTSGSLYWFSAILLPLLRERYIEMHDLAFGA